jgi:hypothetical protein
MAASVDVLRDISRDASAGGRGLPRAFITVPQITSCRAFFLSDTLEIWHWRMSKMIGSFRQDGPLTERVSVIPLCEKCHTIRDLSSMI